MVGDVPWIILHEAHDSTGAVSFEAVLGALVTAMVVTGVLWYLGVFHTLGSTGGEVEADHADPDAGPDSGGGG